ncbi:MAG: GGDEF domain-containing protein [Chloroflexaceae bacterium]|nr:GGDEF domain-containing protein [Chloroflexaceae bacterium]NJL32953.1 GGDEF domain-containing protein [Chloroflexaceae bacterium]NJO07861.1 GGDEF domain-containing protein [Chloroflexaceae bacterium]
MVHNDMVRQENQQLHQRIAELEALLAISNRTQAALWCTIEDLRTANDQLLSLSIRDPLTGLYNRRYMDDMLEREYIWSQRQQSALSVMMIDVDYFRDINTRYGHDGGDALLRALAHTLESCAFEGDIVCRYGGEEFTIIAPDTALHEALRRAEAIQACITRLTVMHNRRCLSQVTVSIGIATTPDHGADAQSLLCAADTALYQAKHNGRNRIVLAGQSALTAACVG